MRYIPHGYYHPKWISTRYNVSEDGKNIVENEERFKRS